MKTEIEKGATLAKVFVGGTNNSDLDGVYIAILGSNPTETPTSFNDGAGVDLTANSVYDISNVIHTIYDAAIDVSKNVFDNTGQSYVKVIIQ